jgi:peptidoglycan hydrolase-like protein with peptidoglycan-binding domain
MPIPLEIPEPPSAKTVPPEPGPARSALKATESQELKSAAESPGAGPAKAKPENFTSLIEDALRDLGKTPKSTAEPKGKQEERITAQGTMVMIVQQRLKERGFNPGPVNGRAGTSTRRAIISFQKNAGIEPTGEIDTMLMQRLGIIGERVFMTENELPAPSSN